jgi:hypothetical protein
LKPDAQSVQVAALVHSSQLASHKVQSPAATKYVAAQLVHIVALLHSSQFVSHTMQSPDAKK